jgi:hypothetical protein
VADFAAARAAQAADFTDGPAWRVVVVHVAALAVALHGVDHLGVAERRQRDDVHGLGHTAGKQAGAVGPRQESDFAAQRTDFVSLRPSGRICSFDDTLADILVDGHREGVVVFTLDGVPASPSSAS